MLACARRDAEREANDKADDLKEASEKIEASISSATTGAERAQANDAAFEQLDDYLRGRADPAARTQIPAELLLGYITFAFSQLHWSRLPLDPAKSAATSEAIRQEITDLILTFPEPDAPAPGTRARPSLAAMSCGDGISYGRVLSIGGRVSGLQASLEAEQRGGSPVALRATLL